MGRKAGQENNSEVPANEIAGLFWSVHENTVDLNPISDPAKNFEPLKMSLNQTLVEKFKKDISGITAVGIRITGRDNGDNKDIKFLAEQERGKQEYLRVTTAQLPNGQIMQFEKPIIVRVNQISDSSSREVTADSAKKLIQTLEENVLKQVPNFQENLKKFLANKVSLPKVSPPATVIKSGEFPSFPMANASEPAELQIFASKPNVVSNQTSKQK